jgi:hypothetical protein
VYNRCFHDLPPIFARIRSTSLVDYEGVFDLSAQPGYPTTVGNLTDGARRTHDRRRTPHYLWLRRSDDAGTAAVALEGAET